MGHKYIIIEIDKYEKIKISEFLKKIIVKRKGEFSRLNNSRDKKPEFYIDVFDLIQSNDPDILGKLNRVGGINYIHHAARLI
jgi:hypothetical protein